MNDYAHRWRLAVALKRPYPSPFEAGALSAGQKETQSSALKLSASVAVAGLLVGWFLAPRGLTS
jgi:hypothetical protein